jgi:hypothetical protein
LPSGLGVKVIRDKFVQKGFFDGMSVVGIGSFVFSNMDIYHGSIKNSKMMGMGTYYKKSLNRWTYGFFQ